MQQLTNITKAEYDLRHSSKILAYAWPLIVILALVLTYLAAPRFYVSYIFQIEQREFQLVEILTFFAASIASGLLLLSCWKLYQGRNYCAASVVGVVGLAALFFAGEEISWGQSYFQWATPAWWQENLSGETNIHNSGLPVHQLAALFIFMFFFLLPLSWKFRHLLPLTKALEPTIPEGPVISAMSLAILFRETKGLYREFSPQWFNEVYRPWVEPHDQFYQEFLWGMNEYRELLVALALLLYASYRIMAANAFLRHNL